MTMRSEGAIALSVGGRTVVPRPSARPRGSLGDDDVESDVVVRSGGARRNPLRPHLEAGSAAIGVVLRARVALRGVGLRVVHRYGGGDLRRRRSPGPRPRRGGPPARGGPEFP